MGVLLISWLIAAVLALLVYSTKKRYSYWKDMGVPCVEPVFLYGSMKGLSSKHHLSQVWLKYYNKLKPLGTPFVGIYLYFTPAVLITSLDFVKTVLVKDFSSFVDRGGYYNENDDPISANLFHVDNPKWKTLRAKLSPTFTSGKIKMMFGMVLDVASKLVKTLESESKISTENVVEIKDFAARYTTDVIGSCAFGLECGSLEDPENDFRRKMKLVSDDPKYSMPFVMFLMTIKHFARKLRVTHLRKEVTDMFFQVVKDTIEYYEKNNIKRNDFVNLLIQLKNTGSLDGEPDQLGKLTIEEIAAQAFVFFLAGFETSSTAMQYTLFELSRNQTVQDKARESVEKALDKHDGLFTYEAMMDMTYLEQCVTESLRKYPPLASINRRCTKDYPVEGTNFVIRKGQMVFIPVYAIHHDPEIYPNPSVYNPDRFSHDEQAQRSPYSYLPFGQGPRNCIGLRFGMMQAKIGLAMLLKNFKFEPCSRSEETIEYHPGVTILTPKNGVYLKVTKI